MAKVNQPDDFGRVLADFERRLRTLETAQRLTKASITDDLGRELVRLDRNGVHTFDPATGAELVTLGNLAAGGGLQLRDRDGNTRAFFGDFNDPDAGSRYGVAMYDTKGDVVFATDAGEEGLVYPQALAQWQVPTPQTITSAAFVEVAEVYLQNLNHDVIRTSAALIVAAATTAEVRIRDSATGAVTNTLSVVGAANGSVRCEWLHPFSVGWGDVDPDATAVLKYEVRRSAGAGNVTAYPPSGLVLGNRRWFSFESAATALVFV